MAQEPNDRSTIREYLLGQLPESKQQDFEQRLVTDDEVFEELLVSEDELIDHYLKGELDAEQKRLFESVFLATTERQDKLRFGRALMNYVSTQRWDKPVERTGSAPRWSSQFFASPVRVAAYALLVLGIALATWQLFFRESDVDKGLEALNAAYRQQRPVEARISQLDYAPFSVTRGAEAESVDSLERDRAERILLDAVHNKPGAASYHALGKMYLAKKDFDKAIEQFQKALKADSHNAQIYADLGATYLEKGKINKDSKDPGKGFEDLARSIENLNKALELDDSHLEALFNRGLAHQYLRLPRQAESDWRKYLEKDPNSSWADEARRNLLAITQQSSSPPAPARLLEGFLVAFEDHNDEQAWEILRRNKEMITGKFLPQQIVNGYLKASLESRDQDAQKLLQALIYTAHLELENAHDPYVSEIATYYSRSSPAQRHLLSQAQTKVTAGYEALLSQTNYKWALDNFVQARELFIKADDEWEGKLCDYWIGYCYSQIDRLSDSLTLLKSLADYCEAKNYKWLLVQATSWKANNHAELGDHSQSVETYNRALSIAEVIGDSYSQQKILSQLASEHKHLGQPSNALEFNMRSLQLMDPLVTSRRQMWRNYLYAARTLVALRLFNAAAAYGHEMLELALHDIKEPGVTHFSYLYLGQIYGGLERYDEALGFAAESLKIGRSLPGETARKLNAYSLLESAHLHRQRGSFMQAVSDYNQAIQTYDQMELSIYKYDAHKGRLLCYVALKNDQGVESELPIVLEQFEQYRVRILEEQNRNTFFDKEQSVYDIAINQAFMKGDFSRALAYSEMSRARSLLDTLNNREHGGRVGVISELTSTPASKPLNVTEIQQRIPANAQLVQYAVLDDQLLIWYLTQDEFKCVTRSVSSSDLASKVSKFVNTVASGPRADDSLRGLGRELSEILLVPVARWLDPKKVLCLVPDKSLFYLPFSAITSPLSGQYLIGDFALVSSPSLNVFLICSEMSHLKHSKKPETLMAVGNPSFDREIYPNLPDLPAAATEAREIAKNYSTAYQFIGPNALKDPIERRFANADVIHFACHYVINEREPMLSKLILAKGAGSSDADNGGLTAGEFVGRKLFQTKLVVLSGCRTGGERYYNGEGMIGLSRMFLAANIPLVVASYWAVDSNATAELMQRFHRHRKAQGLSTVYALRRAQQELSTEPGGQYRDPYYWAAFMPLGGYADF